MRASRRSALWMGTLAWCAVVLGVPVGTAITYQGQLKNNGSPVDDTVEMTFQLFEGAVGGAAASGLITVPLVEVINGLFTVELDFGAAAFAGQERYLQVDVGGTPLTPRQRIAPTPYALHALNAGDGHSLDASDGSPADALFVDATGEVGIGTTTPGAALDIVDPSGLSLRVNDDLFVDGPNSFVGVGRSNRLTGNEVFGLRRTGTGFGGMYIDTSDAAGMPFYGYATNSSVRGYHYLDSTGGWRLFLNGAERLVMTSAGNLGLGTTSPVAPLDIATGDKRFQIRSDGGLVPGINLTGTGGNLGILRLRNRLEIMQNDAGTSPGSLSLTNTVGANQINLDGGGGNIDANGSIRVDGANTNVGTTAGGVLRFGGGGTGELIASKRNTTGNQFGLDFYTAGNKRMSITNPGAVGLGTDSPGMSLEVVTGTYYGRPALGVSSGVNYAYLHGSSPHSLIWNNTTDMRFGTETARATGYVEHMRITGTGDVGIGTGSPAAKLDVNGRARVDSLEIVGGADLAEPFEIRSHEGAKIEPGTVVVIDPEHPGELTVSTQANDPRVAGIVSGAKGLAPGMVLRSEKHVEADGRYLVAMTGRVWCQCDTSSGPIRPGDLLTTSATQGHAMRVAGDADVPRGAILGKAMSDLPDGQGLVLVLVNLQ